MNKLFFTYYYCNEMNPLSYIFRLDWENIKLVLWLIIELFTANLLFPYNYERI